MAWYICAGFYVLCMYSVFAFMHNIVYIIKYIILMIYIETTISKSKQRAFLFLRFICYKSYWLKIEKKFKKVFLRVNTSPQIKTRKLAASVSFKPVKESFEELRITCSAEGLWGEAQIWVYAMKKKQCFASWIWAYTRNHGSWQ